MKETQDFDFNKLMEAISQLSEKVDKLENTKENSEEKKIAAQVSNVATAVQKTGLEGRIETFLGLEIPDISAAYTAIRRAIEEYCKFVKGFDLNDVFLPEGTRRTEKFKLAGIEQERIELLDKIFLAGNKGTHGINIEFISDEEIQAHKTLIRQYVRQLKSWEMADIDKLNGRLRFCTAQDKRLQEKLDSGEFDTDSEQFRSILNLYFKRMNEFMNDYHVDISTIDICFKNQQNVYDYLLDKKLKTGVGTLSAGDKMRLSTIYEKQAKEGDFEACLWMSDYYRIANNTPKSIEYYKLAMNTDGAADKIHQSSNDVKKRAGYALYEAKEYTAALKWIDNIENDVDVSILRGDCYYCENNVEEAIRQYRQVNAGSLKGDNRKKLVANSIYETEPEVALKYYTYCSTANSDPDLIMRIADCYLNSNNTSNAIRLYEKVISLPSAFFWRQQIAQKLDVSISLSQVKSAFGAQCDATIIKFADLLWFNGTKSTALEWYKAVNLKYIPSYRRREIGDYYFQNEIISGAIAWYLSYFDDSRNYEFIKSKAEQLQNRKYYAEAVKLYEVCALKINEAAIAKFLGEYYENNKYFPKAVGWYEKYYSIIGKNNSVEAVKHIIKLHEQAGNKKDAIQCKGTLGDLLFDKGEIEPAILLYKEYVELFTQNIGTILRLAEYYYYQNEYKEAGKILSLYTKTEVLMHKGFALATDGRLFIAHNQHLFFVEKRMVDKLKIKKLFLSNKKAATLYLNYASPNELPKEIVLFEKLHKDDVIVKTLKTHFPKKKRVKKVQKSKSRKVQQINKKGYTTPKRRMNLVTFALLVAILFIVAAIIVSLGEAGGFWKWTGLFIVSFAVLYGMYRFGDYSDKQILGIICWITMPIEYMIKAISDYHYDLTSKNFEFVVVGKAAEVDASIDYLGSILVEPIPAAIVILIIGVCLNNKR